MRRWQLALGLLVLGACVPVEHDWLVDDARLRGILVEIVEPGGYGSLLNVPPGRQRAFVLPLDTVELEWKVAVAPGLALQPPIWLACSSECSRAVTPEIPADELEDCPDPLPLGLPRSCRMGEGHRIRLRLGGAFTADESYTILIIGSSDPALSPVDCLRRLSTAPKKGLQSCIVGLAYPPVDDPLFGLPFLDDDIVPLEVRTEEADVHPTVLGLTVTRERGDASETFEVEPGAAVPVRRGDRIHVEPRFAPDAAQDYWYSPDAAPELPWPDNLELATESISYIPWFSEPVLYDQPIHGYPPAWVVPHDVAPTILWLDIRDNRFGKAFVELQFVPEAGA